MELSRASGNPVTGDHHCPRHTSFAAACDDCQRARAAFLPYRNVDPHPDPASRSFQTNMGPAYPPIIEIGFKEAMAAGAAEGVVDVILNALFES